MRRRLARTALTALAAVPLVGCMPLPSAIVPPTPDTPCTSLAACSVVPSIDITSATLTQSQAVEDFDAGTYVMTDTAALERLSDILAAYNIVSDATEVGDCDGGRTTVLTWTSVGSSGTITVDTCSDSDLAADIDELAADWHESGLLEPA